MTQDNNYILIIIFSVLGMLVLWFLFSFIRRRINLNVPYKKYKIARAGDVNSPSEYYCEAPDVSKFYYDIKDSDEKTETYTEIYLVKGNSMSPRGINDGDYVFIKDLVAEERRELQKNESILLQIYSPQDFTKTPEYKLRNFLGYANTDIKADDIIEQIGQDEIGRIGMKQFKFKYDKFKEKFPECKDFIYSSTLKGKELDFSFHYLSALVGKVQYFLPRNQFRC